MALAAALRRTPPAPVLSAARVTLAEKIAEQKTAKAELAAIDRMLGDGEFSYSAIFAAQERVERAREQADMIQKTAADHLVRVAMGTADAGAANLKTAREELQAAEAGLAAIRDARKLLEAKIEPAREQLRMATYCVKEAADAVMRDHLAPNVNALLSEIESLYKAAAERSNLLNWLSGSIVPDQGPAAPPDIMHVKCLFTTLPETWATSDRDRSVLRAKWKAAHAALMADAMAPLPDGFEP